MDIHIKTVTRARTDGRTDGRGHSHERAPDARCDKMSTSTRCARDVLPDALSLSLSLVSFYFLCTRSIRAFQPTSPSPRRAAPPAAHVRCSTPRTRKRPGAAVWGSLLPSRCFSVFFSLFLCRSSRATLNELNEYARMNTSVNRIAD